MKKFLKRILFIAILITILSCVCCGNALASKGADISQPVLVDAGNARAYIDQNHTLWAWGDNKYGQLGNGTTVNSEEPVRVLDNVFSISASDFCMMAIKQDGTLWAWGNNASGELGFTGGNDTLNYTNIQTVPAKVMDNVAAVCTQGHNGTAVIKKDGSLWLWDGYGATPKKFTDNVIVASLGYGMSELAFVKSDNTLWVKDSSSNTARQVMDDVIDVSAGSQFVLALKKDHTLWAWGSNKYGQLGNGTMVDSDTPVKIMDDVISITAEEGSAAAIKSDYTLWAWGNNMYYKLGTRVVSEQKSGIGPYQVVTVPAKVMDDVVYANFTYRMNAVKSDGTLWTN